MKKIGIICLTLLCFLGCSDSESENTVNEVIEIVYGTSFGECLGYCKSSLVITSSEVILNKEGEHFGGSLPTIKYQEAIEDTFLEALYEKVDFDDFSELNEVIGCPDCTDGGAEWIEIKTEKGTHKVTFEYLTVEIPELKDVLASIRELNESLKKEAYLVIDKEVYDNTNTDNYGISEVTVNEDILKISIGSSGCDGDNWIVNLIDSEAILELDPIQRELKINLINEELCLAIIVKEYEIDISGLQVDGEDEIYLNIAGWDKEIVYKY